MLATTRRSLIGGLAAGSALSVGSRRPLAQSRRITVTSYGGDWERIMRTVYAPAFTETTKVDVDILLGGPPQWLSQIQANPQNPPIHATLMSVELALMMGKLGLAERPDVSKIPNMADVPQRFVDVVEGWGVCTNFGAVTLAYHKDRVKNPPKSTREFVERTINGEWTATIPGVGYAFNPSMVIWSLADLYGGSVDDVGPAFDVIKKMRRNTIFYNSVSDVGVQLQTGDADIGIWHDGRVWTAVDQGAKWMGNIIPDDGPVMIPTPMMKVKNAPDSGWEYINTMLRPDLQVRFAAMLNYPVTNTRVVYPPELKERFTPWDICRLPPYGKMAAVVSSWVERWNREIGG